jgi:nicotinic acid mononucleotide adenylyltransferase
MGDEESIETRVALIEQTCDRCPKKFDRLFTMLDEMKDAMTTSTIDTLKAISDLKVEQAHAKGFKTALWSGGTATVILGLAKLGAYLFSKPGQ